MQNEFLLYFIKEKEMCHITFLDVYIKKYFNTAKSLIWGCKIYYIK